MPITPELQLLLEQIHDDVRGIDARTRTIEQQLAGKEGGDKVRRRVVEGARWVATFVIGAIGAIAGGHYLHPSH